MTLTGERTLPGIPEENYWFRRHEAAYLRLARYCADAVVLEAGCGEGYGAALLDRTADRVLALDCDRATTRHVARRYPGLHTVRGDLAALPCGRSTIDVLASLQVIEHLPDQPGFLAECARALRPGGRLLVTTPNRITFSPGRATPLNPFHTRELAAAELTDLLGRAGFTVQVLAGLHHGPRLRQLDLVHGGSVVDAQIAAALDGRWPPHLLADVAAVRVEDFTVRDGDRNDDRDIDRDIDACLDLIAVATAP
ncbi:MAG TPA: methyltransferase domain-containing protein [Pseudonocardiaceae bacterium]